MKSEKFAIRFERGEKSIRTVKGNSISYSYTHNYYEEPTITLNYRAAQLIIVPDGVQTIGERAFQDYHALKGIKLPSTLRSIKAQAFDNCLKLETVKIPPYVRSIDPDAFFGSEVIIDCTANAYAEVWCQFNNFTKVGNHLYRS